MLYQDQDSQGRWQKFRDYIYLTADLKGRGYPPGYVNCVKVVPVGEEYQLIVTDGYKDLHGGFYVAGDEAQAAGERYIREGYKGWRAVK